MRYQRWRKFLTKKSGDGEIRFYYESTGRWHKFEFYPANGGSVQTQILEGDGEIRFPIEGTDRYKGVMVSTPEVVRIRAPQDSLKP